MNLLKYKEINDDAGVIFSFSGRISQSVLSGIAETLEKEFVSNGLDYNTIHSIFAIFIEQMQNVMNYSNERVNKEGNVFESPGICIVGYDAEKGKYYVSSANMMKLSDEKKLIFVLEKINAMDNDTLRSYYKELRRSGLNSHEHGAGLGFLEMAKKSSEPFEYNITSLDSENAFFEIKVTV